MKHTTYGQKFYWTGDAHAGRCETCQDKFSALLEEKWIERDRRDKENRRKRQIIDALGGIRPFEDFTFEKFRREDNPIAYDLAFNFDPLKTNLYFYGKNRLGKTHLSAALARRAMEENISTLFYAMPDLMNELRTFESKGDFGAERTVINRLSNSRVLVIDDLGLGKATEFVVEVLWKILTNRMNQRRNGLVITSNLSLNDLNQKYGGKIPHRILELCGQENIVKFEQKTAP